MQLARSTRAKLDRDYLAVSISTQAAANISYDIEGDTEDETSDSGIGMLVGIGYAYPILSGTRIAFNLNYAMRTIEEEAYSTVGFSVGGLF